MSRRFQRRWSRMKSHMRLDQLWGGYGSLCTRGSGGRLTSDAEEVDCKLCLRLMAQTTRERLEAHEEPLSMNQALGAMFTAAADGIKQTLNAPTKLRRR